MPDRLSNVRLVIIIFIRDCVAHLDDAGVFTGVIMAADVTYFGAALAGLLSFLSPCVLPLVPPYLCYLGGTTFDQLTNDNFISSDVYRKVLMTSVLFVSGFSTVFVMLGASASSLGQLLGSNLDILAKIAGIIIIIMGLHFIGVFRIPIMYREARYHSQMTSGGLISAYVMGVAFAFGWTPCIGPVLGAILAIAAAKQTVATGASLLLVYSLGLGIPFILAAVAIRPFMNFMQNFRRYFGAVEKAMGGFLVVTGVLFLGGWMTLIANWLLEAFPALSNIG